MWEYVRLEDDTQVSYSEVREDNTVKVVVERPRDWGFDTAECILPAFNWVSKEGFSEADLKELDDFVRNNAPLILRFAYGRPRVLRSTRYVARLSVYSTCSASRVAPIVKKAPGSAPTILESFILTLNSW